MNCGERWDRWHLVRSDVRDLRRLWITAGRVLRRGVLVGAMILSSCMAPDTRPTNKPLVFTTGSIQFRDAQNFGDVGIIIAFSGGGARSAAFGYGVLSALADQPSPGGKNRMLADDVAVVAGVSGGAVLASHFALRGRTGLDDFRRNFLGQDVEASLHTAFTPQNLLRGYQGGMNDLSGFPSWLDRKLFRGATLGDMSRPDRPRLVIHATDLYNRNPFIFDRPSFAAICSNYNDYPLAYAVAASAAVPVVFAPVTLQNFSKSCLPGDGGSPRAQSSARGATSLVEREYWNALGRYETAPDLNYLKLYDGGLVDGIGTQSLLHLMGRPAPEPLPAARARRLRHLLVIVVDASTRVGGDLSINAKSPKAPDAIVAAIDAMINIPNFQSFDALQNRLPVWRDQVIRWRCATQRSGKGCRDLDVGIVRLALADTADPPTAKRIMRLHNRLTLKPDDVDFLSGLGRRLLIEHPAYRQFLQRMGKGMPLARSTPDLRRGGLVTARRITSMF